MTFTEPTSGTTRGAGPAGDDSIVGKLSTLDRYLAVWILIAMASPAWDWAGSSRA